jgi:flagellar biosynthesis chaperone FliJ
MNSFNTLLKIAQRKMDELGIEAARIQGDMEQLRVKQATLLAREQNEVQLAADDIAMQGMLPAYRLKVRWQCDQIGAQLGQHEAALAVIRQRLNEAYQEKSKFEHLLEQEAIRKSTARATLEQAQLDEVAINRAGFGK